MATLLEDIVTYLTDQGLVQGDGIDTFRDVAPEIPDTLVAVYEYQSGPSMIHDTVLQRSVQIVCRSKSATTARDSAIAIYKAMNPLDRFLDIVPDRKCLVFPRQFPYKIKLDSEDRVYYGFNVGITTNRE